MMETRSTLQPGAILQDGKYRIIKVLGQGGFGITYEAEQVALHRKVAVKEFFMKEYCERDGDTSHVTLGTSGSRELVEKFRGKFVREAQMIAGFDHPNIVRIHDVFEENGTAYYVMEYLTGGSLAGLVGNDGPLPESDAIDYVRQIGDALSYLHGQNCLHFDVKPSNILLNSKGRAVLIDFGVSKHYDEGGHQTSSTPVGISKGYAPLEQYQQTEISTFTPATDIYALGATTYYLLTGQTPPEASSVYEDGLTRPEGLSDRMWRVIFKSMQPRRKDRPQSVAAFLRLLDVEDRHVGKDEEGEETVVVGDAIRDKALKPSPGPALSPSPKPSRKGLWIALASGVAALALVLLLLLLLPKHKPDPGAPLAQADSVRTEQVAQGAQQSQPSAAQTVPEASRTGSARINSTPAGAQIWLDGKNTKKVTPEIVEDITVGKHSVKLVLEGYEDYTGTVSITEGKRVELSRTLTTKEKPTQQQVQGQTNANTSSASAGSSGTASTGTIHGQAWVDLGLSVKWATCNVGASSPSDYGRYYAWGETSAKSDYSWETLKYCTDNSGYHFSKYVPSGKAESWSGEGSPDNKTRLDLSDDAARANWGGSWRMPTDSEWTELRTKCKWKWKSQGGKNGYEVTGPNGSSIFLPAAGYRDGRSLNDAGSYGCYWSSSLNTGRPYLAWYVNFNSEEFYRGADGGLFFGLSVRPVSE